MANGKTTHIIRGKLYWAKVLGEPRMNTYTNEREWSCDLTPDEKGMQEIKRLGIASKLKNKEDDRGDFLSFRHREFRTLRDGTKVANAPVRIQDVKGNAWDKGLIGNGTVADVKFTLLPKSPGRPHAGVYIQAIRVLEHVPYETQEFAPLSEDDEFFGAVGKEGELPEGMEPQDDDDLDDIPF